MPSPKKAKLSSSQLRAVRAAAGARLAAFNKARGSAARRQSAAVGAISGCYTRAKALCDATGGSLKKPHAPRQLSAGQKAWLAFVQQNSGVLKANAIRGKDVGKMQKGQGGMPIIAAMWARLSPAEKAGYAPLYVPKK